MSGIEEYIRSAAKKYGWIKYYSVMRPVSIGTCPTQGMMDFINYDKRKEIDGHMAWAEVYYDRELSIEECDNYELVRS